MCGFHEFIHEKMCSDQEKNNLQFAKCAVQKLETNKCNKVEHLKKNKEQEVTALFLKQHFIYRRLYGSKLNVRDFA